MAKELQDWIVPWIDDHYNKYGTDTTKVYGDGKKVQIIEVSVAFTVSTASYLRWPVISY